MVNFHAETAFEEKKKKERARYFNLFLNELILPVKYNDQRL